jgi:hypothetical protein
MGNAPAADGSIVANADTNVTAYYLPGTTGWDEFTSNTGVPTVLTYVPNPTVVINGSGFGIQNNQFGFTICWATNVPVVVEACTDLSNPVWIPVATNIVTGGSTYFSEPLQTNSSGRFYRIIDSQ